MLEIVGPAALFSLLLLPVSLLAQTATLWTGKGDGYTWSDPGNWSEGVPNPTRQTRFTRGIADAPLTVQLTEVAQLAELNFVLDSNRAITFEGAALRFLGVDGVGERKINSSAGATQETTVTFNNEVTYGHNLADSAMTLSLGTINNVIFNAPITTFGTGERRMTITGAAVYTFNASNAASFLSFGGTGEVVANHSKALGIGSVQKTSDSILSLRSDVNIGVGSGSTYSWLQNTTTARIRINELAQSNEDRILTMQGRITGTGNLAFVEHVNSTGKLILSLEYSGQSAQNLSITTKSNGIVRFNQGGNTTYSGILSGDGDVELSGGGNTIFYQDHTLTGRVRIHLGKLTLDGGGSIAQSTGIELGRDGIFDVKAITNASFSYDGELRGNGLFVSGGKNVALGGKVIVDDGESNLRFDLGGGILSFTAAEPIQLTLGGAYIQLLNGRLDIGQGAFDLDAFVFDLAGGLADGDYYLVEGASSLIGVLGEKRESIIGNYFLELKQEGSDLIVTATAIPEPSVPGLLLGVGGIAAGWHFRRRIGRRRRVMMALYLSATTALVASDGVAKPIALVGDSYGRHEVTSITRNILDRADWVFESRGTFLPAEEFKQYALVAICHSQARPYTVDELEVIRRYVEGGGRLLVMNTAPRTMVSPELTDAFREWTGLTLAVNRDTVTTDVAHDAPLLKGVLEEGGNLPSWSAGKQGVSRAGAGELQVLLGNEKTVLAFKKEAGKGAIYYLGSELFRLRLPNSEHLHDSARYVNLIRNIIEEASPLTYSEWHTQQKQGWEKEGKRFLIWDREWQRGIENGPVFHPPLPAAEELKEEFSLELAQNEGEAIQLNFSDLGSGGQVTWEWKASSFPSGFVDVYVQDSPDPIPWPKKPEIAKESPFWLMPPEEVAPKGERAVAIQGGETRIFWLKFHSGSAAPGEYKGNIAFAVGGEPAGEVAFTVRVAPVKVPMKKLITAQPLGHVYGDVERPAEALRFKRNLRELGFEWSLINIVRPTSLKVGGVPFGEEVLRANRGSIVNGEGPFLDFSALDGYIDACIEHGLVYFRVTQGAIDSIDRLCRAIGLDEGETGAVRHWYLSQFARYLQDKGIRTFCASMGDEMSGVEIVDRFLPWSRELARAGWRTTSSFTTSIGTDVALAQRIAPYVGAWTLNRQHVSQLLKWVEGGQVQLAPGALVGTYGAGEGRGTEIRKNGSESRMIGWEAWGLGSDYCSPNPYFKGWLYYFDYSLDRGIAGERFVSYLRMNDLDAPLVTSPFIEGMRESLEEANLAAAMRWYLKRLGDEAPKELQQRASRILSDEKGAILKWSQREKGAGVYVRAERSDYQAAKSEVLSILEALREPLRRAGVKPSLFWQGATLNDAGRVQAKLRPTGAATALQDAIRKAVNFEVPVGTGDAGDKGLEIVVAMPSDPSIPERLRVQLGVLPETYSWIRSMDDPETGREVLWVGGTDRRELDKAIRRFTAFLRSEGDWLSF